MKREKKNLAALECINNFGAMASVNYPVRYPFKKKEGVLKKIIKKILFIK